MSVLHGLDRVRRWGPGASASGCDYCGEGIPLTEPAMEYDVGMIGRVKFHAPCANRWSVDLQIDVARSGYSFTGGRDFKVRYQ